MKLTSNNNTVVIYSVNLYNQTSQKNFDSVLLNIISVKTCRFNQLKIQMHFQDFEFFLIRLY
jgi:hypothetical protein